jgi:hypothetical protein
MRGAHKTYVADWRGINTGGEWRGHYGSGPRGLFYAVTGMPRRLAQGTLTRARITEDATGAVIIDSAQASMTGRVAHDRNPTASIRASMQMAVISLKIRCLPACALQRR